MTDEEKIRGPLIVTSLAPGNTVVQKRCLASWLTLGFSVVSLNSSEEIQVLQGDFPQVRFHPTLRDGRDFFRKPLAYFDDLLQFLGSQESSFMGIVNSDIELRADAETVGTLQALTRDALVYGHRVDVQQTGDLTGTRELWGYDFFFFPRSFLAIYPPTPLCLGVPWWDYWILLVPALKGMNLIRWEGALGFHSKHPTKWDRDLHRALGSLVRYHHDAILGRTPPRPMAPPMAYEENILYSLDVLSTFNARTRSHYPGSGPRIQPASAPGEALWWDPSKPVTSGDDLLREFQVRVPHLAAQVRTLYQVGSHLFEEEGLLREVLPALERIVLLEPLPEIFGQLKAGTASRADITCFPHALSDRDGQAVFHKASFTMSSSLLPMKKHKEIWPDIREVEDLQVETCTLPTFIRTFNLPVPDFLFLDVQGAEYLILSSTGQDLLSKIKIIYTEASIEEVYAGGRHLDELIALLAPTHVFVGFAPQADTVRTHGNALFLLKGLKPPGPDRPLIATSITPRRLDRQKEAIGSWLAQGFEVLSVNGLEEIEELKDEFPEVTFRPASRDARELSGKPMVAMDCLLQALRDENRALSGIVNSDIMLVNGGSSPLARRLQDAAGEGLAFIKRVDHEVGSSLGSRYEVGVDAFFFGRPVLFAFPSTPFYMGLPWWDYYFAAFPVLEGFPVSEILEPVALHLRHPSFYDVQNHWLPMGLDLVNLLEASLKVNPGLGSASRIDQVVLAIRQLGTLDHPDAGNAFMHFAEAMIRLIDLGSVPSGVPFSPPSGPAHREAFVLEPDWTGTRWVAVLLGYLAAFQLGSPVTLILAQGLSGPGALGVEQARTLVQGVLASTGRKGYPDVVLVDGQQHLRDTLRGFGRCHWLPTHEGPSGTLRSPLAFQFQKALAPFFKAEGVQR